MKKRKSTEDYTIEFGSWIFAIGLIWIVIKLLLANS